MAKKKKNLFEKFANWATSVTGSSGAFILAMVVIIVWIVTGPIFKYSDTWQLVINTGTTIVTFLMVFLIQKTQNKDSKAIHLKLNELLASHQGASNRMVDIEDLNEEELDQLHKFYVQLSDLAEKEEDITCTHSIDAAEENHQMKLGQYRTRKSYMNAKKRTSKKSN
ncbi:low affinity iron permease family protein [Mucilaginibacter ginsenosidivorans]|uniref:Low affinity iron permease family protein n=1 Tax=Mucilaginibacter ginsenosidivorans TaxID=398053 RepID=A0A5B8V0B1_9SPHI|nr:low affinity iron permease family protein [Mucilaginibacter ginsenosidivorans]QEC64870.1 low affinity iron permease family protein [Mucilaginibacter ginsenosidivorans]